MAETDWREILSFSQRELSKSDKEKLCESLSWMEADDIELNFSDLKSLFRLAQDILKYKSEQVNNLLGQIETSQRKNSKGKSKTAYMDSPTRSSDDVLETIAHQEEVIKANKEILEQLYTEIADLEGRKGKLDEARSNLDRESESSRDEFSEINAMTELENELTMKNRHIRKLLGDVKILEEENSKLKEKVCVLKDKLTEATNIIESLTEQLLSINEENNRIKDSLGKYEKTKVNLSAEIDALKRNILEKESNKENISEEMKARIQHWKNLVRAKKAEVDVLSNENTKLKDDLQALQTQSRQSSPKSRVSEIEQQKIKELQEKLSEATNEILKSASIINFLKAENKQLKTPVEEIQDFSISDAKNESDDGKERTIINKLKKKVKSLTIELQACEEMVAVREKELTEITSQLQLVKSDEGVNALLQGLKNKKRKLKLKDEGIKSLVQEVNNLNQLVDDLQLQNEVMRQQLNIPIDYKIPTKGILQKYREFQQENMQLTKTLRRQENKIISLELENNTLLSRLNKILKKVKDKASHQEKHNEFCQTTSDEDINIMPTDGGGEASSFLAQKNRKRISQNEEKSKLEQEMQFIAEENEGLRKGLQEILEFLKDNSKSSSGMLAFECPSLESVLHSMEARHSAGWFAPHMKTVMELKAALGGKDALLTALHEARKETFNVMSKLSQETARSQELEQKLNGLESEQITEKSIMEKKDCFVDIGEFGTWMADKDQTINDLSDKSGIETMMKNGNLMHENNLKNSLLYFHNKFKTLFDKMTNISIQTADDLNKWSIQEEKYKAEIENFKAINLQDEEEDVSDISPGIVEIPNVEYLKRKCLYLEESYKYIRTLNENIKNEHLEAKKDAMIAAADYETEIQKLILATVNLTDKLRGSVPFDLFWKQNKDLHEILIKYRQLANTNYNQQTKMAELFSRLETDKMDIINTCRRSFMDYKTTNEDKVNSVMVKIEHSIFTKQLEQVCAELDQKNKDIEILERKIYDLQESQAKLIDDSLASSTKEDVILMNDQLQKLSEGNSILKEQCKHVESQLDIALLQLQDSQQRQMSNDMEINMLRHQILDLQSIGDNKAIIARLSGEVLVAHLQASESHKKIERLNSSLNKEKQLRIEAEEMLSARQNIFEVYSLRHEAKFRYMYEVLQILRIQYQGSLPIISLENYLNGVEELVRKKYEVDEKFDEIDKLHSTLLAKHAVFDQILDVSKNKCLEYQDSCPHRLQNIIIQGTYAREIDHFKTKLQMIEQSRKATLKRCNDLEKTLVLVNQALEKPFDGIIDKKHSTKIDDDYKLEMEDINLDDEDNSRRSGTITLPEPQVLKPPRKNTAAQKKYQEKNAEILLDPPASTTNIKVPKLVDVFVQTSTFEVQKQYKIIQTEEDCESKELKEYVKHLEVEVTEKDQNLKEARRVICEKTEEMWAVQADKIQTDDNIHRLNEASNQKDKTIDSLRGTIDVLRMQIDDYKRMYELERQKIRDAKLEENKSFATALNKFEENKDAIIDEYKDLLSKERKEYAKSVNNMQNKIKELQTELERTPNETSSDNVEALKEVINKYAMKIKDLEGKCFQLESNLEGCKSELSTNHSEIDRWRDLANDRLTKMEQLSSQLEERHCQEVDSYKAENEHWVTQLHETQREHNELRSRLTEQKSSFMKQLTDKDSQIEHLKTVVHGLKTQIMTMQTMMSINDPSFDLSAIVEVEESVDVLSVPGASTERLELKYGSSVDLHDSTEDMRVSTSATNVWQDPLIERLRREKMLTNKQNSILRRQIKALAARERRARLDAQNLKNQIFRISTTGNKVATAETAALHNKVVTLQAQLMSARRDTQSTVALWDKCKRAQQTAERWQARFEEKCREVRRLESSLSLAKSSVLRLEKEKRILLARISEVKCEKVSFVEKQDSERGEKPHTNRPKTEDPEDWERDTQMETDLPISSRALLDRVEAQQRRIAALETADKGNEHLVSEYEKALAEITSLKGQVLKLESTLLEAEMQIPLSRDQENQPEMAYWKNYCEMLKEENVQLNLKVSAMGTTHSTGHQQRIGDLEQTILTLRGLVSKLQSEQKSSHTFKRLDSRPSSARSVTDKNRTQLESYRTEIANLKRTIQDKDNLLERSKEMLKIAAEREEDLLRENASLRWQLNEIASQKRGFLSA